MSKRTIWIVVVIALLVIVGSIIFLYSTKSDKNNNQDTDSVKLIDSSGNEGSELSNTPETEFSDLETSDNDFNEIDSAVDYIE